MICLSSKYVRTLTGMISCPYGLSTGEVQHDLAQYKKPGFEEKARFSFSFLSFFQVWNQSKGFHRFVQVVVDLQVHVETGVAERAQHRWLGVEQHQVR
jgi:hypothetical protein